MKKLLMFMILMVVCMQSVQAEKCRRFIAVYDIAVCVPNAAPELFQASEGCVQQLLLNSQAVNEFFSIEFQPMRILKPAVDQVLIGPSQGASSNTDYLIWGELKQTGTGRYSVQVNLVTANTRQLVARGTSVFQNTSEAKFAGMTAALSIGGGNASRRLIDVITDFEKKIREEDKRKAVCPEVVFLNPDKAVKTEAKKEVMMMFQVKDPDGRPVEEADVYVRSTEGTFDKQEAKTDRYGMVKFKHTVPDKRTAYDITCFAKTVAPSEKLYTTDDISVPVKVGKTVTQLVGEIEIHTVTKTGAPNIGGAETEKSVMQSHFVSSLDVLVLSERIKQLNKSKEVLSRALSQTSRFEIVTGVTLKNESGEPTSVRSESEYEVYNKCDDKWELSRSEKIRGSSNGFDIGITISLERGVESGNITVSSLSPRYCLTISGGSNSRQLFQTGKYRTTGTRTGQQRDVPCGELTSFSEELDPKSMLPFGVMQSVMRVNNMENQEMIIPLSISNSKALEDYLLDPEGSFVISVSGKHIKKDYQESDMTLNARVVLLPKE